MMPRVEATVGDVTECAQRARSAQVAWGAIGLEKRRRILLDARQALLAKSDALVALLISEGGKVPTEARLMDIGVGAATLSWTATEGPKALVSERVGTFIPRALRSVTTTYEPRGVCGLLTPWNYPVAIPMGTIAPALLAGNAVLWKPSELVPQVSAAVVDVLVSAGVPRDVLALVQGGPEVGAAVVEADIDHLTFVGGSVAGRVVAGRAGSRLLPAIIELGGKAPCIVLDDDHLERAARAIVFGGLMNGGQSCVAVERVYVVDAVFDAVFQRVRALAGTLRPGRERGRAMLRDRAADIAAAVADASETGGPVVDVTHRPDSPLLTDESFGAVLPFVRVRDADEAVQLSNAHPLQLAAYVFGDAAAARDVAARLAAPMVGINDVLLHYALPQVAFGGRSGSGYGRVHGVDGLRALTVAKTVIEAPSYAPDRELWWHPYGDDGRVELSLIDKALALYERLKR